MKVAKLLYEIKLAIEFGSIKAWVWLVVVGLP